MTVSGVLGVEQVPPGEDEAIRKIIEIERQLLERRVEREKLSIMPRGQHPKGHGCVRAEFVVEKDLPSDLQVGVFQPGKTYPAWIRFSNARKLDDRVPDGHGMAIKLMGVPGVKLLAGHEQEQTQDFVLLDHPVFFIRDAIDFAEVDGDLLKSATSWIEILSLLTYFAKRRDSALILAQIEAKMLSNPLHSDYWSVTPYKFGAGAVKYLARPTPGGFHEPLLSLECLGEKLSGDRLHAALKHHLESHDAQFDFCTQRQLNSVTEPIEDAMVEWKSPVEKVATINIRQQTFDSVEQMKFCEDLSFNPWHSLPDHQPLGSLNRLRKAVYAPLSKLRHERNGAPEMEPNPETSPA